jgi:hypothetical protein
VSHIFLLLPFNRKQKSDEKKSQRTKSNHPTKKELQNLFSPLFLNRYSFFLSLELINLEHDVERKSMLQLNRGGEGSGCFEGWIHPWVGQSW